MTSYLSLGFTTSALVGSIASVIAKDIIESSSPIQGFPEITVKRQPGGIFEIIMNWKNQTGSFTLSDSEAQNLAAAYKNSGEANRTVAKRIVDAFVPLEVI